MNNQNIPLHVDSDSVDGTGTDRSIGFLLVFSPEDHLLHVTKVSMGVRALSHPQSFRKPERASECRFVFAKRSGESNSVSLLVILKPVTTVFSSMFRPVFADPSQVLSAKS